MKGRTFIGAAAALLLWAGIAQAAPPPTTPVKVALTDAAGLKRAIAAQKGHVVVVNFWATYCGPCVAEFPRFVALNRQYKGKGLVVFVVSADTPRALQTKVQPFLTKQGVTFPAFLIRSKDPEEFIDAFDASWQGDLPRTYLYDKQGRRVKTLSGEQTGRTLAAAVAPLLK